MARVKEEDRKVADRPLARNLDNLLSQSPGFTRNLDRIYNELGIKRGTVRKWVTGERNPSLVNLEQVCNLYNYDIRLLFEDPDLLPEHLELIDFVRRIKDPADIEKAKTILSVFIR